MGKMKEEEIKTNEQLFQEIHTNGIDDILATDWIPIINLRGEDVYNVALTIRAFEYTSYQGQKNILCVANRIMDNASVTFTIYDRNTQKFIEMIGKKKRFPIDIVVLPQHNEYGILFRSVVMADLE